MMVFEQGFLKGFGLFFLRPFTNPVGIILLLAVGIYIFLRISGKIRFRRDQGGGGGGDRPDFVIK